MNFKDKTTRQEYLTTVPRMYYQTRNNPCNFLKGLDQLVEENLNSETVMVEIGSYAGVSSELFAESVKQIYCVDLWQPYPEISSEFIYEGERRFDNFASQYNNVTKVKKGSEEASKQFENKSLDFVYVDAFHVYEAALKDIDTWLPKIKDGGAIGGHDSHLGGVRKAVMERFGTNFKTYHDKSWFVRL